MLNMPPQGAVLSNMVSLLPSLLMFTAFLVLIVIVFFFFFVLSFFLMNKDVYIILIFNTYSSFLLPHFTSSPFVTFALRILCFNPYIALLLLRTFVALRVQKAPNVLIETRYMRRFSVVNRENRPWRVKRNSDFNDYRQPK